MPLLRLKVEVPTQAEELPLDGERPGKNIGRLLDGVGEAFRRRGEIPLLLLGYDAILEHSLDLRLELVAVLQLLLPVVPDRDNRELRLGEDPMGANAFEDADELLLGVISLEVVGRFRELAAHLHQMSPLVFSQHPVIEDVDDHVTKHEERRNPHDCCR